MISQKIHECRTRVRYGETDQMGVVYHGNYLVYFEMGRTEFLRSYGLAYRALEERGIFLAVTRAELRFRASARYDDPLLIRTRILGHGPARVHFGYEVFHEATGMKLAEGSTELACLDESKRPRKLPAELQSFLEGKLPK